MVEDLRTGSFVSEDFVSIGAVTGQPTDGDSAPFQAEGVEAIFIGHVIAGQYEILEEIGTGAWGVVYKARQRELDRPVAVKVLKRQLVNEKDKLARFKQEARAISSLCHRNILQVVDYGVFNGKQPYCVMEFFESESLDVFAQHCTDGASLKNVLLQTLSALSYAHGEGIIHRDIKPGNILVQKNSDGEPLVKLVDFGIAKLSESENSKLTATGELLGTPMYMSPEQCSGDEIDQRSDLYSLGCVIYEILSGHCPFQSANSFECMLKHVREEALPLRFRDGRLADGALQEFIKTALAKSKSDRFETADAMAAALANLEIETAGLSVVTRAEKRVRSSTPIVCTLIACILAAGLFCSQFFKSPVDAPVSVPKGVSLPSDSSIERIDEEKNYSPETYQEQLKREVRELEEYARDLRKNGNFVRAMFIENQLANLKTTGGTRLDRSEPELCLISASEGKPVEKFSDRYEATVRVSGHGAPVDLILCGGKINYWKLDVAPGTKVGKVYVWANVPWGSEVLPASIQFQHINGEDGNEWVNAVDIAGTRDEDRFRRYIRHLINRNIDSILFADPVSCECVVGPENPEWTARVLLSKIAQINDEAKAHRAAQIRKKLKGKQFWALLHKPVVPSGYQGNPEELQGTHQISLFDFEGPIQGTVLDRPTDVAMVTGDRKGPLFYKGVWKKNDDFVQSLDLKTKQTTKLKGTPEIPDPAYSEFLAFDSLSQTVYGVGGFIEAYDAHSRKWKAISQTDIFSGGDKSLNGVAFDPVDKSFYTLCQPSHPNHLRYLYRFGLDGKLKERITLSQPIHSSVESNFTQQLIWVDGYLVSITPPVSTPQGDAQVLMYVIEPRTGKVVYAEKMKEHRSME